MTQNRTSYKICLVTVTLSDGGAERCAATLSHFFVNQGFEVHHLVFSGKIEYDYSGEVMHLAQHVSGSNRIVSRIKRFTILKKYLKEQNFDYVIDFRVKRFFLQEFIIHNYLYKNHIQTIHSNKLDSYISKNKFLANLLYKNCKQLIAVSKGIEEKIKIEYNFKNIHQIYNPIDFEKINEIKLNSIDFEGDFILAAGSMNKNVKQFDHLIECYSKSNLPDKNIKLIILGDGKLKQDWIDLADRVGQKENIIFKGNVENPFAYYSKALFTVLTSKYEGLPMVLIESLACETPVLAYNCETGPSEIINHLQNGLLVENQNKEAMIAAINTFYEDKNLYLHCKNNCKTTISKYEVENIGNQWLSLFKQIKNEH
ncbi:glycosyltransferase [Flavobacterium chungnamense]|uniref:Glycosyltransferase n=1 Tax=Flavobacterium chungnamense TaxID=706182 RepID=A0ABP7UNI0_9FLAO